MARGTLRIYLGAAPGVGKTSATLDEGRRRAARGTDLVTGFVETHGRAETAARIGDLDVVPRRTITYRLAVARGFVEAMGGTLTPEDTPGGGLTMAIALPAVPRPAARGEDAAAGRRAEGAR
jgi:K+-sensing histidine kinase KdpD